MNEPKNNTYAELMFVRKKSGQFTVILKDTDKLRSPKMLQAAKTNGFN